MVVLLLFAVIPAYRLDAMGNEVLTPNQQLGNKPRKSHQQAKLGLSEIKLLHFHCAHS